MRRPSAGSWNFSRKDSSEADAHEGFRTLVVDPQVAREELRIVAVRFVVSAGVTQSESQVARGAILEIGAPGQVRAPHIAELAVQELPLGVEGEPLHDPPGEVSGQR